jgi:glyoxylase-like metal-dependent hydrolase (beta-lactamase superfamily II)
VNVYAFQCGTVTAPFRGEQAGDVAVPVPCYLVEHRQGLALIDTGLHLDMRADPHARIGWLADLLRCELPEREDVGERLRALGVDPGDLRYLVNTHLHFDHAGGNAEIPQAVELVVQRGEWAAGRDRAGIEANFYNPADYGQDRPLVELDGVHDLFGDGSVVCFPTPGHTPGHQSIRLNLSGGDTVICADACYFADWMDTEQTPPHGFDKQLELRSLRLLRKMRDEGARMIYGHDAEEWSRLPKAPEPLGVLEPVR